LTLERSALTVSDQFDVEVHDAEALEEIEMLANLIVATSEHDGRVPQHRIDEILGLAPSAEAPEIPDHEKEVAATTTDDPGAALANNPDTSSTDHTDAAPPVDLRSKGDPDH
jgi:hypothetical protein